MEGQEKGQEPNLEDLEQLLKQQSDLGIREVNLEDVEHLEETFAPGVCWGDRCYC